MKSVFNKDKGLDATKQSMFFGPDLAVQRYDTMRYPIFDKMKLKKKKKKRTRIATRVQFK